MLEAAPSSVLGERLRLPMRGAQIRSIGAALPPTAVPNTPIADRLGVNDHWIYKRIGVRSRHVMQSGERLEDLVTAASQQALARAEVDPAALDLVLVGTFTQDEVLPNAAPLVAARLGAESAGAVDVGAACMGFISALALGSGFVESGRADTVLVAAGEQLTRYLDMDDRRTAALIGDGAGAVVLSATEADRGRIGSFVLRADDRSREIVYMTRAEMKLRMDGQRTFAIAVDCLCDVTLSALATDGLTLDDIDLFIYHQANARILRAVGERLDLPADRVINCIEELGNTSAASIPLALAIADEENRLHDGSRLLLASIGAGFIWGAGTLVWGADDA
jgi:3-oxoacyl-[acyl-carrier-protein] synthase-3